MSNWGFIRPIRPGRTLLQSERPQRLVSPGLLAGGVGETGHHRVPPEEPAGRLPAADVYDARREHCGGESVQRLAGIGASGTIIEVERKAIEEGHGL